MNLALGATTPCGGTIIGCAEILEEYLIQYDHGRYWLPADLVEVA